MSHNITRIAFDSVPHFSQIDKDYSSDPTKFSDFLAYQPSLDGLVESLETRKQIDTDRQILVDVIRKQYNNCNVDAAPVEKLLDDHTYTIVTAHQPSLLTGPLYFIYKICSAVNLAKKLNDNISAFHIIPVFVLGGEDHDFDEMNHARFFGKEFTWETDQSGSVGRMGIDSISSVLNEIKDTFGDRDTARELAELIDKCFSGDRTYGVAMQEFVLRLFADIELIVLQMDDPSLKKIFGEVIKDELLNETSSEIIPEAQARIEQLGYKPQAYVRDINLFYLADQMRNRIIRTEQGFEIVDSDLKFSVEEMVRLVDEHPERFSPNVNLRPLYQEMVLPNLAYIGGGGELAYWLERKEQFAHYDVPFPVLIRRNSCLYVTRGNAKQLNKLDLKIEQLFGDPEHEISEWVRTHAEHEVDISQELSELSSTMDRVVDKAKAIDPSFARKVEAFKVKTLKDVEHFEKRLVREEKARLDTNVNRIRKLFEKLFPEGNLQERYENFIPLYLSNGREIFKSLIEHLDPLTPGMIIIEEE